MRRTGQAGLVAALIVTLAGGVSAPATAASLALPVASQPATPATSPFANPSAGLLAPSAVPDPVTFLPQAPASRRENRPEAVLGFAGRHEPASAAVPRPTTSSPSPVVPNPAATPTPATPGAMPAPTTNPGAAQTQPAVAVTTGTIQGTVRNQASTAIAGIGVNAYDPVTSNWAGGMTTLADGSFTFTVPAGSYVIQLYGVYPTWAPGWWCGGIHLCAAQASATVVIVAAGGSNQVDPKMDPYQTISGTVHVAGGAASTSAVLGTDTYFPYNAVQADGTFSLLVEPGVYKLAVAAANGEPAGFYAAASSGHWTQLMASGDSLSLPYGGANVTGLSITLPAVRHISGTLTDTAGNPIQQYIDLMQGSQYVDEVAPAVDGTFSFTVPQGASYTLHAAAYQPYAAVWYASGVLGYADTAGAATVLTAAGSDITGLTFKLPPIPHIKGKITLHTGAAPRPAGPRPLAQMGITSVGESGHSQTAPSTSPSRLERGGSWQAITPALTCPGTTRRAAGFSRTPMRPYSMSARRV